MQQFPLSRLQCVQVLFAAGLAISPAAGAVAPNAYCGQQQPAHARISPLSAMRSATPIYAVDDEGRLSKLDLRRATTTVLTQHGFNGMPNLQPSADGRWLSYDGVTKGHGATEYWLLDRRSGTERLIYSHPAWGGGMPAFSPNSRYLAISASHDSRWPSAERAGIFIYDTHTQRLRRVPLPARLVKPTRYTFADWSADGKELLILVRNEAAKVRFDYYSYRLSIGKLEALTGQYDRSATQHRFKRDGRFIATADSLRPRSDVALRSDWSTDGLLHAQFDQRPDSAPYHLIVEHKGGRRQSVATGSVDACMGQSLRLLGWVDARHLVYNKGLMQFYIFDAYTGRTATLFSDDSARSFTW